MRLKHITLAAALLAAFATPYGLAQDSSGSKPLSRDEVKAEGTAAHKSGAMEHGEASKGVEPGRSKQSRAAVKAEGTAAHKADAMEHGEASKEPKVSGKSTKARKDVKAAAEAAHKDGTMQHGEATQPPAKTK